MNIIPDEILCEIIDWLTASDILPLKLVCKRFWPYAEKKWIAKVNWRALSHRIKINEDYIAKYADYVNWIILSMKRDLSEKFIEKYMDKVDLVGISYSQKLSENFIGKHIDKLALGGICMTQKMSEQFILSHPVFLEKSLISILAVNQNLSDEFIREHMGEEYLRNFKLRARRPVS